MKVRSLIRSLFAAAIGILTAHAQSAPAPARQFEFSVFCDAPIPGEIVYQAKQGEIVPITLKPYRRTGPYVYAGDSNLALAKTVASATADGRPSYELMSRVAIASTIKRPLLLFLANSTDHQTPTITVIEDDPSSFGRGTLVVLNYSGFLLQGFIDGSAVRLQHGGRALYPGSTNARVQLAMSHKDRMLTSFDQKVTFESTERTVLLLLPPQRKSSPLVRWILLTDEVSVEEPESEARP